MKTRIPAGAAAVALVAALLPVSLAGAETREAPSISPAELHARQARSGLLVLDVRTPEEFAAGHIPGARNIPHTELPGRALEVRGAGAEDVVVYCMRGPRARLGEAALLENGVRGVAHLEGGFLAWSEAKLPVEGAASD